MANFNTIREVTTAELSDILMLRKDGEDVGVLLSTLLSVSMPVGSTYMTVNPDFTPSSYGFLGSWSTVDETGKIVTGQYDGNTGSISGTDEKPVVLKRHNHSATCSTEGGHQHTIETSQIVYGNYYTLSDEDEDHIEAPITTSLSYDGAHDHTVTVSSEGEDSPTINVAGKKFHVCVWKRTA